MIDNGVYIISDKFFEDFPDPNLRGNDGENRPHFYCFKESATGLYWVIPLSHKVEKYEGLIKDKESKNKPCDVFHIISIAGAKSVFIIGDMFPINDTYIQREYTIDGIHLEIKDTKQLNDIKKKAKKVLQLIRRNIPLHDKQPNVLEIERKLLEV